MRPRGVNRSALSGDGAVFGGSLVPVGSDDSGLFWFFGETNLEVLVKGKPRCTLQINPADARARGIAEGDGVRITAATGSVVAPAEVTDRIMSGVVSLPHGWGHHRPGVRLGVAASRPGALSASSSKGTRA